MKEDFTPFCVQAYAIEFQEEPWGAETPDHRMFGAASDSSDVCPNCALPLMRMLSLDLEDVRLGLNDREFRRLDLLYCWRCRICESPFYYSVDTFGAARLIQAERGLEKPDFPYEPYPRHFPEARARLLELDGEIEEILKLYFKLLFSNEFLEIWGWDRATHDEVLRPRHQFGGIPFSFTYDPLKCIKCEAPMKFLVAIADQCTDPRGFVENNFVQVMFFFCAGCNIVGARNECD